MLQLQCYSLQVAQCCSWPYRAVGREADAADGGQALCGVRVGLQLCGPGKHTQLLPRLRIPQHDVGTTRSSQQLRGTGMCRCRGDV